MAGCDQSAFSSSIKLEVIVGRASAEPACQSLTICPSVDHKHTHTRVCAHTRSLSLWLLDAENISVPGNSVLCVCSCWRCGRATRKSWSRRSFRASRGAGVSSGQETQQSSGRDLRKATTHEDGMKKNQVSYGMWWRKSHSTNKIEIITGNTFIKSAQ